MAQRQLYSFSLFFSELDIQYGQFLRQEHLVQIIVGQDFSQGFRRSILVFPDICLVEPGPLQTQETFL